MDEFDDFHKNVLENLKHLRKLNGFSHEYVGQQLGITKSGYGKIESGINLISLKHLYVLSVFYEISLDILLFSKMSIKKKNPNF